MGDEIKRMVEASLRVANELERQAQMQREAAARMLLRGTPFISSKEPSE